MRLDWRRKVRKGEAVQKEQRLNLVFLPTRVSQPQQLYAFKKTCGQLEPRRVENHTLLKRVHLNPPLNSRVAKWIYFFWKKKWKAGSTTEWTTQNLHLPPNDSPCRIFWENYCCWTVNLIGFFMANPSLRKEWEKRFSFRGDAHRRTENHKRAGLKLRGRRADWLALFVSAPVRD